jgi:hypothetical protein
MRTVDGVGERTWCATCGGVLAPSVDVAEEWEHPVEAGCTRFGKPVNCGMPGCAMHAEPGQDTCVRHGQPGRTDDRHIDDTSTGRNE